MRLQNAKICVRSELTATEAAKKLGLSRQLLEHHAKTDGAPARWNIPAWRKWLDDRNGDIRIADADEALPPALREQIAKERLRLLKAEAGREEIRLAKDQKLVVDRSEVEQALHRIIPMFFDEMETEFCHVLPPVVAGKTPEQIAAHHREAITKIMAKTKQAMVEIAKG